MKEDEMVFTHSMQVKDAKCIPILGSKPEGNIPLRGNRWILLKCVAEKKELKTYWVHLVYHKDKWWAHMYMAVNTLDAKKGKELVNTLKNIQRCREDCVVGSWQGIILCLSLMFHCRWC